MNPLVIEPEAKATPKLVPAAILVPVMTSHVLVTPGFQKVLVDATALVKSIEKTDPGVTLRVPLRTSGTVKLVPAPVLVLLKRVHW